MSAKHTPGPWTTQVPKLPITRLADNDRMILARAFDGYEKAIVSRVHGGTPEEANANARLIGAAPDMLAALHRAVETIRALHGVGSFAPSTEAEAWALYQHSPEMQAINAAIQKAEGVA